MAIVVETGMAEDLALGTGDVTRTHQSGGSLAGHGISLSTFSTKGAAGVVDTFDWTPGDIASSAKAELDVTVQNAAVLDFVLAAVDFDLQGCTFDAQVSAANTVTAVISNNTGGQKTFGAGTLKVAVFKTR